jgi:hypothetical protein
MKELKEQFPLLAEQDSFDEPEEVGTVQFWPQKKAVKLIDTTKLVVLPLNNL